MKKIIIALVIFNVSVSSAYSRWSFSFSEPTWQEMIDFSDMIAEVEFISSGVSRADAKILKLYKGQEDLEEIHISRMAYDYYGDSVNIGSRFILFLLKDSLTISKEEYIEYLEEEDSHWPLMLRRMGLDDSASIDRYIELKSCGVAFNLWTPRCGRFDITGDTVQYDLVDNDRWEEHYYPLDEFEEYLEKAIQKRFDDDYLASLLEKAKHTFDTDRCAQYLMMLSHAEYNKYDRFFDKLYNSESRDNKVAFTRLLTNMDSSIAAPAWIKLLNQHSLRVFVETAEILSEKYPESAGPILLNQFRVLSQARKDNFEIRFYDYDSVGVMLKNLIDIAGELKHRPFIEVLIPLLHTGGSYEFDKIIESIEKIDPIALIPIFNGYLRKGYNNGSFDIIVRNNLKECKPAMKKYISINIGDKYYQHSISPENGIAFFNDDDTREFLLEKFRHPNMIRYEDEDSRILWIRAFIKSFAYLKCEEARPLIFKELFPVTGYNMDFIIHPQLCQIKKNIEDSINTQVREYFKDDSIVNLNSIAYIKNTDEYSSGFKPRYEVIIDIEFNIRKSLNNYLQDDTIIYIEQILEQKICRLCNIKAENLILRNCDKTYKNVGTLNEEHVRELIKDYYKYADTFNSPDDKKYIELIKQSKILTEILNSKKIYDPKTNNYFEWGPIEISF